MRASVFALTDRVCSTQQMAPAAESMNDGHHSKFLDGIRDGFCGGGGLALGYSVARLAKFKTFKKQAPSLVYTQRILLISLIQGINILRVGIEYVTKIFHVRDQNMGGQN